MLGFRSLPRDLAEIITAPRALAFALMCAHAVASAEIPISNEDIAVSGPDMKKPSPGEWAALPPFCAVTMSFSTRGFRGSPSPRAKPWADRLGDGFWASHHYCWAEISAMRSMRHGTSPQERKRLLVDALKDYWYVINNSPKNFILLPEIYTRIGEAEVGLSHPQEANQAFARARALKPDYWPAYSHWAEYLIKTGNTAEAKRLVKEGLEYSPNAKLLREQYRMLGGNPSEIVSKVPKTQEAPVESAADERVDQLLMEEPAPPATARPTP